MITMIINYIDSIIFSTQLGPHIKEGELVGREATEATEVDERET